MGIFTAWGAVKQGASLHSVFPPVPFGPNQVGKRLFPTLCNFSVPAEQSKESAKSELVSVCLLNNLMATLMTRGALLLLSVLIASRTPPTSVFSHSALLPGNSHLLLTFTCLTIKELINVLQPCFLWD